MVGIGVGGSGVMVGIGGDVWVTVGGGGRSGGVMGVNVEAANGCGVRVIVAVEVADILGVGVGPGTYSSSPERTRI